MAPMKKSQSSGPGPFTTYESKRRHSSACTAGSTQALPPRLASHALTLSSHTDTDRARRVADRHVRRVRRVWRDDGRAGRT